jgi:hypothetical protein
VPRLPHSPHDLALAHDHANAPRDPPAGPAGGTQFPDRLYVGLTKQAFEGAPCVCFAHPGSIQRQVGYANPELALSRDRVEQGRLVGNPEVPSQVRAARQTRAGKGLPHARGERGVGRGACQQAVAERRLDRGFGQDQVQAALSEQPQDIRQVQARGYFEVAIRLAREGRPHQQGR